VSENPFMKPLPPGTITGSKLVQPKPDERGGYTVVVLDRVEHGVEPEYCVHGKATCHGCSDWCWLGDNTYELVASGEVMPLCQECASKMIPPDSKPIRNAGDHRRADGPH